VVVTLVLLLLADLSGSAPGVTGVVVDAQDLPVAGARVQLVCDGGFQQTATSSIGKFRFETGALSGLCTLSVASDGFETENRTVSVGAESVVVRLSVARFSESVQVSAALRDAPFAKPIGSVFMTSEELMRISDRTEDVIRTALLASAGGALPSVVYVDGMRSGVLPPAEMIGHLSVNANPFSAEYGDGDVNRVQIVTRGLSRRFRASPTASLLGFGGGDGLRRGTHAESSSAGVAVSGPVPSLPVTFSANVRRTANLSDLPIAAVVPPDLAGPGGAPPDMASSWNEMWSRSVSAHYGAARRPQAHVAYSGTSSESSNVGVGGLVFEAAGLSARAPSHNVQAGITVGRPRVSHEAGFVVRAASSTMRANSAAAGVSVSGYFVDGGSTITEQESRRVSWSAKYVMHVASARAWSIGLAASRVTHDQFLLPNPHGSFVFESAGAYRDALAGHATAARFVQQGNGSVRYTGTNVAPFVQATLIATSRLRLDAGVRGDAQSGVAPAVSPRIWTATLFRGFTIQSGIGLFVEPVSDAVFVRAIVRDGMHLREYFAEDVALGDSTSELHAANSVTTHLASNLAAPRQVMHRSAVERQIGPLTPSLEYTWSHDSHRLGTSRVGDTADWIDRIESTRSATRHRIHARLGYRWRQQSLTAHYEWVRAFDNGDGAFSYPERSGDLVSEWARSAMFSPHYVSAVGNLVLPAGVYATVTGTWQSSTPFNITSGIDEDGNGLFTERGGRPRNDGVGPRRHLITLQASRRINVAELLHLEKSRVFVTAGAQIDNVLNSKSATVLGSIAGSATFARPIAAMSGRAVRFWINVG